MTHYKSLLLALLFAFAMIFGGMGTAAAAELGEDTDNQTLAYEDDDWDDEGDDWGDDDWDDEGDDWDDDEWDEGDDDW